jgi:NADPH2:quinone reductase
VDVQAAGEIPIAAAIVDAPGSEPRLGTVVLPPRAPGSTLVEVLAAPLNPLDLLIASGTFHSVRHESAYVPGSEFVGVVIESDRHEVGSHVYGECHASPENPGAMATRVIVSDVDLISLPEGVDPVSAAAIGNSGVAAYLPLVEVAGMRAGDTVLVLGATGTVGQLAVQVAHQRDAGRVVGVGRHRASLARLLELGADAVIELRDGESAEELAARLVEAGAEAQVVFDAIYGLPFEAALVACARSAHLVNVGHSAGLTVQVPAGVLRGKQLTIHGFAGLHVSLQDKASALAWLWTALAENRIAVDVQTFPLSDIAGAWRGQAGSPHAKYVVLPGGSGNNEE